MRVFVYPDPRPSALSPSSLGSQQKKQIKLNSLWSLFYQHFHYGYFHLCCYHYHRSRHQSSKNKNYVTDVVLISVLLTLRKFHALLWYLYRWLWTNKCPLGLQPFRRLFSLFQPFFSWGNFILKKIIMELLMVNEEKVMDHYLFNIKFTV